MKSKKVKVNSKIETTSQPNSTAHSHPMPAMRTFSKPLRDFNNPVSPPAAKPAFIPAPPTNNVNLNLPLDIVVPGINTEIVENGVMVFHAVGDTGGIKGTEVQESLAELMQQQVEQSAAAQRPRFFFHLGDVVYFNGMSSDYPVQFYEPYQTYNAPIFAIPGNHDGDTRTRKGDVPDDETTLFGFIQNFCAVSAEYLFKHRETMTQPYVYWTLETPLATIIGLYSNVDGNLDAAGTFEQQRWLEGQLKDAPKDIALILTVHHPAYSLDSAHGGYPDIGTALDRAFNTSGRTPDLILSGHVHSYQRFTRQIGNKSVPYIIAGAGGYADSPRAMHQIAKDPATGRKIVTKPPFQTTIDGLVLSAYNDQEPGFLLLTVTKKSIAVEYHTLGFDGKNPKISDTFSVDL